MTEIISERCLGFGFSAAERMFSLPGPEKFSHKLHFGKSFPTLAFSLHLQQGLEDFCRERTGICDSDGGSLPETKN